MPVVGRTQSTSAEIIKTDVICVPVPPVPATVVVASGSGTGTAVLVASAATGDLAVHSVAYGDICGRLVTVVLAVVVCRYGVLGWW